MSPTRHALQLAAVLAVTAPALVGCGAVDDDMDAQYPQQAIGYDGPDTPHQAAAASLAANPPSAPVQEGQEGQGGAAAGQAGSQDVAIGVDSDAYADTDPSALTEFKPALDPYGTWVDDPSYGTIWVPSQTVVGSDFTPYVSAGHWTYGSDYVWVSDYEWGWAPFHYGRWVHRAGGWGWIPGRTYAGAWVTWRTGYDSWDYVGWAPLAPSWYWRSGYAYSLYFAPPSPFVYCGYRDVFHPAVAAHVVVGSQAAVIAGHTQPYVRAQPSVASGGPARVPASPRVNAGPPPGQLGIASNQVAHPPATNAGLARAAQLSRPSTALAVGARAPAGTPPAAMASRPLPSSLAPVARGPSYVNPSTGTAFRAPTPRPSMGNFNRPTALPSQPSRIPSPSYSHGGGYGGYSAPAYGSHSSFGATPSYGGAFHGSSPAQLPTYHTQPTFQHVPAPHTSVGAGHFSGGGVGHFGGGARGGRH